MHLIRHALRHFVMQQFIKSSEGMHSDDLQAPVLSCAAAYVNGVEVVDAL